MYVAMFAWTCWVNITVSNSISKRGRNEPRDRKKKQIKCIEGIKMSHFFVWFRFRMLLLNELLKMLSSSHVEPFICFLRVFLWYFRYHPEHFECFFGVINFDSSRSMSMNKEFSRVRFLSLKWIKGPVYRTVEL